MNGFNLITVLLAGFTTGGLTCFAVQGGLLTSVLSRIEKKKDSKEQLRNTFRITSSFILAKAAVYTLLGFFLGLLGSMLNVNSTVQAIIQILASIYMVGVALQLLNVHPIFRYFIIQPPASLQRIVRKISKGDDELTTPIALGLVTLFIPCGTTLAMEAMAIASSDPVLGALTMFTFVIASSWIFFAMSAAASVLSATRQALFYKVTAVLLIVLGVYSFNASLNLLGSPYSLEALLGKKQQVAGVSTTAPIKDNLQKINITITSSGYQIDKNTLKVGVPVELTLQSKNAYSCASAFTIPSMNIFRILPANGSDKVVFTPSTKGKLVYSCSMGMYRGQFDVL